jgi:hypothetical protein
VRLIRQNVQTSLVLEKIVLTHTQALQILDAWENLKELTFGMLLGIDDSEFATRNKFRKLEVLKILSPDWDDCISFYRSLLNHLIRNNALKRLKEIHIEARNVSNLLTDAHWQLLCGGKNTLTSGKNIMAGESTFKKIVTKEVVIFEKSKIDIRKQ